MPAVILQEKCYGCGMCIDACRGNAIKMINGKAVVDEMLCMECGACVRACNYNAIVIQW